MVAQGVAGRRRRRLVGIPEGGKVPYSVYPRGNKCPVWYTGGVRNAVGRYTGGWKFALLVYRRVGKCLFWYTGGVEKSAFSDLVHLYLAGSAGAKSGLTPAATWTPPRPSTRIGLSHTLSACQIHANSNPSARPRADHERRNRTRRWPHPLHQVRHHRKTPPRRNPTAPFWLITLPLTTCFRRHEAVVVSAVLAH